MPKLLVTFLTYVMTSSDLRNGRHVNHEKYLVRKARGVIKFYQSVSVFLFDTIKNKTGIITSLQCQKCLCSQRHHFHISSQILRL